MSTFSEIFQAHLNERMRDLCDGTGTEIGYAPAARLATCAFCRRQVSVESDEKRTWLVAHASWDSGA